MDLPRAPLHINSILLVNIKRHDILLGYGMWHFREIYLFITEYIVDHGDMRMCAEETSFVTKTLPISIIFRWK